MAFYYCQLTSGFSWLIFKCSDLKLLALNFYRRFSAWH